MRKLFLWFAVAAVLGAVGLLCAIYSASAGPNPIMVPAGSTVDSTGLARADLDMAGYDIQNTDSILYTSPTTDAATTSFTISSQGAYEGVNATNTAAGNLCAIPRTGAVNVTGVTKANTALDTIAFTGVKEDCSTYSVTFTEGTDYTCAAAADDATCVCNLKTAIDAHATLGPLTNTYRTDATCSDEKLAIFPTGSALRLLVTPSDAVNTAVTAGTNGQVLLPDGSASVPALAFASDTDTGILLPSANAMQFATNGVWRLMVDATEVIISSTSRLTARGRVFNDIAVLNLGKSAATGHSMGADDALFGGGIEVDGAAWFDGAVRLFNTYMQISAAGSTVGYLNGYDDDGVHLTGAPAGNRNVIITEGDNMLKDHDHDATSANPTLFVHSVTDPDSNNTQWISMTHNVTNGYLSTGAGYVDIQPAAKGVGLPKIVGTDAPTEPVACAAGTAGVTVYVDDTNDSAAAQICVCAATTDDGGGTPTMDWRQLDNLGAACSFF